MQNTLSIVAAPAIIKDALLTNRQSTHDLSDIQPLTILPQVFVMPRIESRNVAELMSTPISIARSVIKTKGVKKPGIEKDRIRYI